MIKGLIAVLLALPCFGVRADTILGDVVHTQSFSVASVQLSNEKSPFVTRMQVQQGGVLHIKGRLSSPDMISWLEKGSCLYVRFLNRLGRDVAIVGPEAGAHYHGLRYSKWYKCGFITFRCGPESVKFDMSIPVPAKAVIAEIGVAKLKNPHTLVLSRFRCEVSGLSRWRPQMKIVSLLFLVFVGIVFVVYFLAPGVCQPLALLAASIVFYAFFNLHAFWFLGASAVSIWLAGLCIKDECGNVRKWLLVCVVGGNIGALAAAKYLCPAIGGLCDWFDWCRPEFSIVLPLGISFYTLQAVSYCVDVYRGTLPPERNFFKLFLYLIFFPTIMQGPISRYGQLGAQLWARHSYSLDRMQSGLELALWGFFKKMVIADRAAMLADAVFAPGATMEGFPVLLGVVCYSIQIYADFSGCVDICRGICEVMGIDLIDNFKHPYFATSIKDFWRRWHISLSTWLRDYVYIPLGGNRHGTFRKYLNVLIVFGVSGIWHGVGVNFFIWGLLHGAYQVFDGLTAGIRKRIVALCGLDEDAFSFRFGQRVWTFALVTFAWIFFRAQTIADAWSVIKRLFAFNPWVITNGSYLKYGLDAKDLDVLLISLAVLLIISVLQERGRVRAMLGKQALWFRWSVYLLAVFGTLVFGIYGPGHSSAQFIYMQF